MPISAQGADVLLGVLGAFTTRHQSSTVVTPLESASAAPASTAAYTSSAL